MTPNVTLRNKAAGGAAFVAVLTMLAGLPAAAIAQDAPAPSVETFVRGIYAAVSATGGQVPDWDKVRGHFLKESVIVLRTGRTATTVFSLEGFLKDFIDFYDRPMKVGDATRPPKEVGFTERVVQIRTWEFREMAQALVLYEAHVPGSPRTPQQGIDNWLLVRRDGRWWVAAVTNEIITPDHPVPPGLKQ